MESFFLWDLAENWEERTNGCWETMSTARPLFPLVCNWQRACGAFQAPFLKQPGSRPSLKPQFFPDIELLMATAQCPGWVPLALVHPLQLQATTLIYFRGSLRGS